MAPVSSGNECTRQHRTRRLLPQNGSDFADSSCRRLPFARAVQGRGLEADGQRVVTTAFRCLEGYWAKRLLLLSSREGRVAAGGFSRVGFLFEPFPKSADLSWKRADPPSPLPQFAIEAERPLVRLRRCRPPGVSGSKPLRLDHSPNGNMRKSAWQNGQ
jgi:hypothetical protein